jgi:gas vesicle protein
MMSNHDTNGKFMSVLSAFALGSLIGAGIALLMAPQSGEETRQQLRDRGMELRDRAEDTMDQTRHRAEKTLDEVADRAKKTTEDVRQRGHEAIDKGRSNF